MTMEGRYSILFSGVAIIRSLGVHDSSLGALAVAGILCDVGDQARIENALAIVRRINATIEVEMGASEVQPDLFGHLLQSFQTLRQQDHVRLIDGGNW